MPEAMNRAPGAINTGTCGARDKIAAATMFAVMMLYLPAGFVRKIAHQHGKVLVHAVSLGILAGGAHAHGVNIHALGFGGASFNSNGQNAGAGADIQHTLAALYHAVQRFRHRLVVSWVPVPKAMPG